MHKDSLDASTVLTWVQIIHLVQWLIVSCWWSGNYRSHGAKDTGATNKHGRLAVVCFPFSPQHCCHWKQWMCTNKWSWAENRCFAHNQFTNNETAPMHAVSTPPDIVCRVQWERDNGEKTNVNYSLSAKVQKSSLQARKSFYKFRKFHHPKGQDEPKEHNSMWNILLIPAKQLLQL